MKLRFIQRFLLGLFSPRFISVNLYGIRKHSGQLYRVHLKALGAYKLKINDCPVHWQDVYLCSCYKNTNYIKFELKGLITKRTHIESVKNTPLITRINTPFVFVDNTLASKLIIEQSHLVQKEIHFKAGSRLKVKGTEHSLKYKTLKQDKIYQLIPKNYSLTNLS